MCRHLNKDTPIDWTTPMTRRTLGRRLRARARGECGFTLVETIFAITVIFGSLLALAYTATIGFGYGDIARQKTAATGVANQLMEEIRGLAYDTLAKGMLTSDLAIEAASPTGLIKSCGTPVVYRYVSCTAGSTPGSGEKIVGSTSAASPTVPLVPHQGTIVVNHITYSWSTFVSNNCPVVDAANGCSSVNPFRVTVGVKWTGGTATLNKVVQIQSLFFSPTGCLSTATHPFATPCQPFFFGEATVPQGQITINAVNGGIQGTTFQTGTLYTGQVETNVQQEQLSQVQGGYTPVGVSLTDGSGTTTAGAISETTTAADSDPGSSSVSAYATRTLTVPTASMLSSPSSGSTQITLTTPAGDSARNDSTTSAGGTNVCPPPTDTAEADGLPCGGSRQQQGGVLTAVLNMGGFASSLGSATLAQAGVASSLPNKVFGNRVVNPTSGTMCTPASGMDGCLEQTGFRRFGTITLGGLPSAMTAPANWSSGTGFLSIVGYQDQVAAAVGKQSTSTLVPAPSASVTAGTVSYWNGSNYTTVAATAAALTILNASSSFSQTIGGHTIVVTIATVPASMTAATTSISPSSAALSIAQASAQATPPRVTLSYTVALDGTNVVELQISVDLRTMEARGVYGAAPSAGS
jgi:type II secretory pathway pseudopilin PulG